MSEDKIYIQNEIEMNYFLEERKGCKYMLAFSNCKNCGIEFKTSPKKLLLTGFLCKKCKISNTKKNASTEFKEAIQQKRKQTCLKKYGVDNVFKSEDIKSKIKDSLQELYGVQNAQQLQTMEGYVKKADRTSDQKQVTRAGSNSESLQAIKVTKWDKRTDSERAEILKKRKATNLEKYGTEFAQQSETVKEHYKQNSLQKWGVGNPSRSPIVRAKAEQTCRERYGTNHPNNCYFYDNQSFDSSWELAVWIWAKDNNLSIEREPVRIEYEFAGEPHYYYPDFCINNELVEIKGPQFFERSGKMINPFDKSGNDLMEAKHLAGLARGVKFWSTGEMKPILDYIDSKYTSDYLKLFLKNLPFPYPKMRNGSDFEVIRFFHRSLYHASRQSLKSPYEAWQDKELVKRSALNRLKYVKACTPEDVVQGFNVAKIAPKVSIFKPSLAENLIKKYLNDVTNIVDPFSGFSGRLLGATNLGKSYTGYDINIDHVRESNEIIDFKKIQNATVTERNLLTTRAEDFSNSCTALFTCPPYGGKEHWNIKNDEVEKTCDEWIDLCLNLYKNCKRYLFVVDVTERYKDNIVEEINNRSHLGKNTEKVIIIEN